ncbi:MAG: hypothetical protein RSD40_03105 [Bacilli bacterium]
MNCPICKKEIEEDLKECPYCGTPLKIENDQYIRGEINPIKKEKYSDLNEKTLYEKNNTIAGLSVVTSFILLIVGAILISLNATIYFSFLALVPCVGLAAIGFFKSRPTHFKFANTASFVIVILGSILTLLAFLFVLLKLLGLLFA